MNKKIVIIALAFLVLVRFNAFANPGDSGAAFLRIGEGAKPSSLAGAYAGVGGEIISLFSNPAGLSSVSGYEFSFSHAMWIDDISYYNFAAGAPLLKGYAAAGFTAVSAGEIDKYNRLGDEMGDSYNPTDMAFSLAYSRLIREVSAGVAVKFITSDIADETANAFALDLGAMKRFGLLNTGFSVQNIGTEMKYREDSDPLPLMARVGVSYPFYNIAGLDFLVLSEINISKDIPFKFNAGVNADYPINESMLSLRLGFKSYAEGLDTLSHFTGGLGIKHGQIAFNYALVSFQDLGLTHRVSLDYSIR